MTPHNSASPESQLRLSSVFAGGLFALVFSVAAAALSDAQTPDALEALHAGQDWQHGDGGSLDATYASAIEAQLSDLSRADAITALTGAGYECIYGEAHEDYPEPAAQCTRSFATRACQMDWEVFSTAADGRVDEVSGSFRRDCVGVDKDWPEAVRSAIDDQLAPMPTPKAPN